MLKSSIFRGNSAAYLPKVIESMECILYKKPNVSVEEVVEQICAALEIPDNIWVYLAKRQQH